jgi:single-strand DNA-binding protein
MAGEQYITIRGRLVADPELRFTGSGTAVANFTIAANSRTFDKQTNEWKDNPAIFWRCNAWKELGENVAASLQKADGVIALATLESREWEDREGNKRTSTEARIEAIGPDLRWVTARPEKPSRGGGQQSGGFGGGQQQGGQNDPWGAGQTTGGNWGTPNDGPAF